MQTIIENFNQQGAAVLEEIYTNKEIQSIVRIIEHSESDRDTFRKSQEVFAIRQVLKEIPALMPLVFNHNLKQLLHQLGPKHFLVKSIYFDKPETSNWYVSYHQDLTISVNQKTSTEGFGPWTVKQNQFAVQPPVSVLENIITLRIHLDNTTSENGALRVIPGSHLKGIYRPETINWEEEKEQWCTVPAGGVMLMKPLTLHASGRTTNHKRRRVLHLEFSNITLPTELTWSEKQEI